MDTEFLVVGTGLGGLAFAGDVAAAGRTALLLDKSRGVGGRAATRRWDDVRVDHGAQFFTARGARFRALVGQGIADGWLMVWSHGFPLYENGGVTVRPPGHPRYACPNGMSDLPKHFAAGLDIQTGAAVTSVERVGNGYCAVCADGRTFTGERLVLNMPPVQVRAIADPLLPAEVQAALGQVTFAPTWTLIARLEADIPGADWPALEFADHPVLAWTSRDHTKRGSGAPPVLVAHGSGAWSAAHLEDDPESVTKALLDACVSVFGALAVRDTMAHRWLYAQPIRPLGQPFLLLPESGIGVCGDWCGPGGRIEGALDSGWGLAAGMLR